MRGWPDFHRLFGNIDVAQRFELVMHTWQLPFDMLLGVGESFPDPGDIEIHAAVRCPPPFLDLAHDTARNVIASQ